MRFIADDGKIFDTRKECESHELELKAEKERLENLKKEKKNRWDEVTAAFKTYRELLNKFYEDYDDDDFVCPDETISNILSKFWS